MQITTGSIDVEATPAIKLELFNPYDYTVAVILGTKSISTVKISPTEKRSILAFFKKRGFKVKFESRVGYRTKPELCGKRVSISLSPEKGDGYQIYEILFYDDVEHQKMVVDLLKSKDPSARLWVVDVREKIDECNDETGGKYGKIG